MKAINKNKFSIQEHSQTNDLDKLIQTPAAVIYASSISPRTKKTKASLVDKKRRFGNRKMTQQAP
jgi:uncharacterized membrane protein